MFKTALFSESAIVDSSSISPKNEYWETLYQSILIAGASLKMRPMFAAGMIVLGAFTSINPAFAGRLATTSGRSDVKVYMGPRARPSFAGNGSKYLAYKTRITEGFATNAIADGHYVMIEIGCGTGCRFHFLGNLIDGNIIEFPIGGEYYQALNILTDTKSDVFVAKWMNVAFTNCTTRQYVFDGVRFIQMSRDSYINKACID